MLPRRPCNQTCAASDLSLLDHLEYDGGGLARLGLADETLRSITRLEGIGVDAETEDVGVCGDQVDAPELFALRDGDNGLYGGALAGLDEE